MPKKIVYSETKSKCNKYLKKKYRTEIQGKHWIDMRGGELPHKGAVYPKQMT